MNPRVGEARQPWLATHLGDENYDIKPGVVSSTTALAFPGGWAASAK